MKITSVLVISMLLGSRHNAAVSDGLSCCPSAGVGVLMGGWRWRTSSLLTSGNRWPHRVTSRHDQWCDRHSWLCTVNSYITLIHLRRGLDGEPEDVIVQYILHNGWQSCLEGLNNQQADRWTSLSSSRKHLCHCDCSVSWWWLVAPTSCHTEMRKMSDSASIWTPEWPFTHLASLWSVEISFFTIMHLYSFTQKCNNCQILFFEKIKIKINKAHT